MAGKAEIQHDVSDAAMVAAIEANLFGLFALMSKWPGAEVHDERELVCTITDVPFWFLNMVLRARLAPDRVDDAIEAIVARGRARGVPVTWWTGPSTRPADLGRHLVEHGFVEVAGGAAMAMDLASLSASFDAPSGLRIERAGDAAMLRTWCQALAAGFEAPQCIVDGFFGWFSSLGFGATSPVLCYTGCLDGEPVATSTLALAAGIAGIYCVGTVPAARGKGIGTAMTYVALREARRRGYRVSILQASEMGYGVYQKLGFREYFRMGGYEWTPGGD